MQYRLRTAKVADIAAIRRIDELASQKFNSIPGLSDLASSAAAEGGVDEPTVREWLSKGQIYVAEPDGTNGPVGFVASLPLTNAAGSGPIVYIAELGVVPGHQGKGLGTRLVRAVIHPRGEELGIEKATAQRVALTTFVDIPWNKPWYLSKFGFREVLQKEVEEGLGPEMAEILAEDKAKLERPGWRRCCLLWEGQTEAFGK